VKVDLRFLSTLISITLVFFLLVLSGALAVATFIDNDFGPEAARAEVYETVWFQGIALFTLFVFTLLLILRKFWQKGKRAVLLLYIGIILVFAGYGLTQYAGYQGFLHLREGDSSDQIESATSFLQVTIHKDNKAVLFQKALLCSPIKDVRFHQKINFGDETFHVRCLNYFQNGTSEVVEDPQGGPVILLQVANRDEIQDISIQEKETRVINNTVIGFQSGIPDSLSWIQIRVKGDRPILSASHSMTIGSMIDHRSRTISPGNETEFLPFHIYEVGPLKFGLVHYYPNGRIKAVDLSDVPGLEPLHQERQSVLVVEIQAGEQKEQAVLFRETNRKGIVRHVTMKGCGIDLSYGSKMIKLPFAVRLRDFQVERYPGSLKPSGFISNVVIEDPDRKVGMPYPIYMNHTLKYRGYRFFQSSFDEDEAGSVLLVSHDPGTPVFYAGYILLLLGFIFNLFGPKGRFHKLSERIHQLSLSRSIAAGIFIMLLYGLLPVAVFSESAIDMPLKIAGRINFSHSRKFGELLIQDPEGRIKPLNSCGHELMHDLFYPDRALGLHPDQIILSMMIQPSLWFDIPVIKIDHPEINLMIGIDPGRKWASYNDCFDAQSDRFKLIREYQTAQSKSVHQRTRFDKAVLNLQKRIVFLQQALNARGYHLLPVSENPLSPWRSIDRVPLWSGYKQSVRDALQTGDWHQAGILLSEISQYQKEEGLDDIPGRNHIRAEIIYNEWHLPDRLTFWVLALGILLLTVSIFRIFIDLLLLNRISKLFGILLTAAFILQTFALGLRWYISGHAPLSNQYESMVFIAWVIMFAGWILSRRNAIPFAAASLISGMVLNAAHSHWVDPKIANLPPVLKSHWMLTHVSIIISSYGFFGLSAFLGLIVLFLYIFKTGKTVFRIESAIQSLTCISEKSIILGYILVLSGTFLGAVWANESWGRYWGWDPKETWTLIVILVYTVIVYLHRIPEMYSSFIFNVSTFLAFFTILMTYIGVNFYLTGLHSYASGDPMPVPFFFYVVLVFIAVIIGLAFRKRKLVYL